MNEFEDNRYLLAFIEGIGNAVSCSLCVTSRCRETQKACPTGFLSFATATNYLNFFNSFAVYGLG